MTIPISDARLQANIANAQLSTGPRSPEGKAASAANSRSHGLCAKDLVIAPAEQEEFALFQAQHLQELKPDNAIEQTLFEQIVVASWNLRRVRRLEAALQESLDPVAALQDEALQKQLDRLARHHTRIERSYYRALKELKALQTERHNRSVMTPNYPIKISPLVNSIEISKRTQFLQLEYRATSSDDARYTPKPRSFQNEAKRPTTLPVNNG